MAFSKHIDTFVVKRNGSKELLDIEKIHRQVMWATEGISGVSASELEIKSQLQFYNGIKTHAIQETLIKAAADLISEEKPNYQYVAGRLINYHIRKEVYGGIVIPKLEDHVKRIVDIGYYDKNLLEFYSSQDWNVMNTYVDHDRDNDLTYVAMEQWRGKYLVKNRVTGQLFETPQMAYILIAATLFSSYPKDTRLKWVKDYYDAISQHDISLPTPVMAGVRTPQRQFSSCVLIEADDSINSLTATSSSIVRYVSQKAGIGINVGRIRSLGSSIRKGDAYHTGVVPFIKLFQSSIKSCNQGGIRSGAGTLFFQFWNLEYEDLIVLKNNKGTEDNRARHLDYCVQFNKLAYERLLSGGNITLFTPNDVPEMYEAFFNDQDKFKMLYEAAEKNTKIRKKTMKAIDVFTQFMNERKNTGRIYLMNVDHANSHSSFDESVAPIRQSNLCTEILIPTKPIQREDGGAKTVTLKIPLDRVNEFNNWRKRWKKLMPTINKKDPTLFSILPKNEKRDYNNYEYLDEQAVFDPESGSIALCTLSAINWGKIREPKDFEKPCMLAVRGLDALLSYQDYPLNAAETNTMMYRNLGIGIINFAYWLAKNGLKYTDDSALPMVDEYAEAWSYYLIKASVDLAKEFGACEATEHTKYSKGIVPIDTRKLEVDELVPYQERMPWDKLRTNAKEYGIRNAVVCAIMPAESSAALANATNGIEPPRAYVSIKQSKDGVLKQVVPEYKRLKNKYELLWDQKSPEGYLKIVAVLQKYIDQTISANVSYNPLNYSDKQLPMSEMLKHMLLGYKWGHKTWYYMNTMDGQGEFQVDKELDSVQNNDNSFEENDADQTCDSCVL